MRTLIGLGILVLLMACKEAKAPLIRNKIEGEIEVVNGTDVRGLGDKAMRYLRQNGYNVVRVVQGEQNFDKTIIALRTPKWAGVDTLKKDLQTNNVIVLENPDKMLDVTVYIGRDQKDKFDNE